MKTKRVNFLTALLAFLCAGLSMARADVWNKKTIVTFREPVALPGTVLEPGTYVMSLLDSSSNRNIVQIRSEDERRVYATLLAIPKYRMEPADESIFNFDERPSGQPRALKSWFYPGDTIGREFRYSKAEMMQLASAARSDMRPVEPAEPAAAAKPAETESPAPEETDAADAEPAQEPAQSQAPAGQTPPPPPPLPPAQPAEAAKPPAETGPETMPETASALPLLALAGLLSFAAAWALRAYNKRRA
jgi:hypothetical protein